LASREDSRRHVWCLREKKRFFGRKETRKVENPCGGGQRESEKHHNLLQSLGCCGRLILMFSQRELSDCD
jgi:hypothetical protein